MVTVSGNSNLTYATNPTNPTNPTTINSGELTDKNRQTVPHCRSRNTERPLIKSRPNFVSRTASCRWIEEHYLHLLNS